VREATYPLTCPHTYATTHGHAATHHTAQLAIAELERVMQHLNFVGIQIGTNVNELNLDAPELFPILKRVRE
jgi:predicted TIM-barrel fold metal-dependent hydrolase